MTLVAVVGRHYQPGCLVAGIIVTMHDHTVEAGRHLAALRAEWGERLLEPPVPNRVAVREALAAGVPLAETPHQQALFRAAGRPRSPATPPPRQDRHPLARQ